MPYDHQAQVEASPVLTRNDNPNPNKQPEVAPAVTSAETLAIRHAQDRQRDSVARGEQDNALVTQPSFRR
jgi:hypothetical protein